MTFGVQVDEAGAVSGVLVAIVGPVAIVEPVPFHPALCQLWEMTGTIRVDLPGREGRIGVSFAAKYVKGRSIAIEF